MFDLWSVSWVPNADPPGRRQDMTECCHTIISFIRQLVPRAAGQALPHLTMEMERPRQRAALTHTSPAQTLSAAG